MEIFFLLLIKLIPLYILVFLGYIAGKFLKVNKEQIATLLIYIISPIVIFNGAVTTKINFATLSLPILFFLLGCFMCLCFYFLSSLFWKTSEKNILAFTAGTGNTGYFGIPVALAIFGERNLGLVVFSILGFVVYENSLGFYITAKGKHTSKDALKKVLSLPTIYAFCLGLLINIIGQSLDSSVMEILISFRGAYTVLGMMLVGLGIAGITKSSFDFKFSAIAFGSKFVVWPILISVIVFLDNHFLHLYNTNIHKVMFLMSMVPLASNTVAFAAKLNTNPEKSAVSVLLSTVFALIYIPIFISIFFPLVK